MGNNPPLRNNTVSTFFVSQRVYVAIILSHWICNHLLIDLHFIWIKLYGLNDGVQKKKEKEVRNK